MKLWKPISWAFQSHFVNAQHLVGWYISNSTKLRKAKETLVATLSVSCPGQENKIFRSVRQESLLEEEDEKSRKRKSFDTTTGLIGVLIKAHDQAQSWQTKRQIFVSFCQRFYQSELQKMIPGLSNWRIDQARQHAIETGNGQPVVEQPIFRCRSGSLSWIYFKTRTASGCRIWDKNTETRFRWTDHYPRRYTNTDSFPHYQQYKSYCDHEDFEPASERSLYRMLEVCSASLQKSLQGLDNVTAEGKV